MRPLLVDRVVPVSATPVVHGSHRACEAALGRGLAHDRIALPRPHPVMGEAEEVECRALPAPSGPVRSEVQVPRLVRVEPQPVPAKAQCSTIRLKLFKIAAVIRITTRKVWLSLSSVNPFQHLYATALRNLRAPFPRTGPGGPGSPPSAGSMRALRLPALHPFGLLIHQPAPRCACLFAPGPPQAGPDPLLRPVVRVPAIMRGQCGASQVPRRAIPWLCGRSLTPDDPLRLACSSASGAAPAIIRTKTSTLRISRLNSVASPPAVYASRRALPHAMQHSLPAGGLRLYRAGVKPTGSRCKGSTHRFLLARAYPGAI